MQNVFVGLQSIESGLGVRYALLTDVDNGESIALIRATGEDFLTFTSELAEKVKNAALEYFVIDGEDADNYGIDCLSFDADSGISTLLCGYNNKKFDTSLTLSVLPLY